MGIIKEFREFAIKGNVIDMAVGIIIGGAFGKIVTSLVNDIIMPPIGMLINGIDFKDLKFTMKDAGINAAGEKIEAVTINYGNFIQTALDFTIVAFSIFLVIRILNNIRKRNETKEQAPPAPAEPSQEVKLLTEIRDLLRK